MDPTGDKTMIPCRGIGCSRDLIVPAGPVRAAARLGHQVVAFCSHRCQVKTIAIEGEKAKEANIARRHNPSSVQ